MPKMSRVKLLKKIKIPSHDGAKWTFATALFDTKGRVRRDHVMVNGKDEVHPELHPQFSQSRQIRTPETLSFMTQLIASYRQFYL